MPPRRQKDWSAGRFPASIFRLAGVAETRAIFLAGIANGGERIGGRRVLQSDRVHGLAQGALGHDRRDVRVFQFIGRAAINQVEQQLLGHGIHCQLGAQIQAG